MASGVSAVELRAKEIFTALTEQDDAVILLDEIDRLILDRDSRLYQEQGDMFQVLTPGMLPKLKQLRSRQRSIFILATNYKERLEPAAIRIGRIDKHFLVSLPDLRAREKILVHELKDEIERSSRTLRQDNRVTTATIVPADLTKVAEATALGAYGELCELVRTVTDKLQANGKLYMDMNRVAYFVRSEVLTLLEKESLDFVAAVRLENYQPRFRAFLKPDEQLSTVQEPIEEFIDLAGLICETAGTRSKLTPHRRLTLRKIIASICEANDSGVADDNPKTVALSVRKLCEMACFSESIGDLNNIATALEGAEWKE